MENIYDKITAQVVELLERGVCPWRSFLQDGAFAHLSPSNHLTRRNYTGINNFLLACAALEKDYAANTWLTFKQAQQLGGHIRKGEKSVQVVFWSTFEKEDPESQKKQKVPFLKAYSVFNVEQTEGIALELPATPPSPIERSETCEAIISNMPNAPRIQQGGAKACYVPSLDLVNMPHISFCDSQEAYYSTLYHELVHATGHDSRLARKELSAVNTFGSPGYAREELVAEMGAAFLCAHAGISAPVIENQAAYLQSWIKVLKGNSRLLVEAASKAQKASDYILNRHNDEKEANV